MNLASNTQRLIEKHGRSLTLTREGVTSYDPETSSVTQGTPETSTFKGYIHQFNTDEVDGSLVLRDDRKVAIPALDTLGNPVLEPQEEDRISGVSDTLVVKGVRRIYNRDTLVCYICHCRG